MKLKASINPIRAELSCLNCVLDHTIEFNEQTKENYQLIRNKSTEVLEGCKCEGCNCNTFNVELFQNILYRCDRRIYEKIN